MTLWLFIVVGACYVAYGYSRLWKEWREIAQPIDPAFATEFDPAVLAPTMPLEGPWSFAKLDWDVRSQLVAPAEVAERFEKLAASPATTRDEQLPDVSSELVELAEQLGAQPIEHAGNRVFQLERPNLKARLIARTVVSQLKVVALAVALPHSAEQWQFFELIPRGATGNSAATLPQLLPLPPGARRDGGRFANDGQALLELVSLDATADELFSVWKAAGWEVRPNGAGSPHEFSYLCARGIEVIYAWSADPRDAIKNLMLVRTPSGPDTNRLEF